MSFSDNGHFLNTTDVNFGFEWDFILKQEKEIASHKTLLNLAIQAYKGDKKPEFLLQWHTNQLKELKQFKVLVNQFLQDKNGVTFKPTQTPSSAVQTIASIANSHETQVNEGPSNSWRNTASPKEQLEFLQRQPKKVNSPLDDLEEWDNNLVPTEVPVLRKVEVESPLKQKVVTWRDLSSTSSSMEEKSPVQKKWLEISQRASDLLKETPLHSQTPIVRRDMFFLRFKGKENSQKEQDTSHDTILAQKGWESTSDANQIRVCEELLDEHESTLQTKHSWTSSQNKSESETSEDVECDQSKSN